MKKVIVIVGPTAVGKSDAGIYLAQNFNGEIISGDSIQVYKGLDIGSGKVSADEKMQAVHHNVDNIDPKDDYSVANFQIDSRRLIDEISNENKLPIIVGGTGLYIKACLYDYVFSVQENYDLSKYETMSNEQMYQMLEVLDPNSLQTIHINNRQRIIRALSMAENGVIKSEVIDSQNKEMLYDALIIGLTCERELLYKRINKRVENMIENGLENEIDGLLNDGVNFTNLSMQGIGYKEWHEYFSQQETIDEVCNKIQTHSRQFAKKQYTWFNNQMDVNWIDITDEKMNEELNRLVGEFINE